MKDMTIREAAEAAGCTTFDLRNWCSYYNWPNPRRNRANGRMFSPGLVELLRRVVAQRDAGTPIGQILGTGAPCFPRAAGDQPPRTFEVVSLAGLPEPQREDGKDLRHALLASLSKGAAAPTLRRIAEARLSRVHPLDRPAILALVERIEQTEGTR